jgi:hypothetical protein
MASSFKNAGMTIVTSDNASANFYTCPSATVAVIHALYISNKSSTNVANVDVKVTTDGGTTFYHIGKSLEIDVSNTLIMDKPINLEANDIIRIVAESNEDSSSPEVEAFASILEIS